jgi:hypothetical protein
MKTKEISRIVGLWVLILAAAVLVSSCAIQTYSGPLLPREKVAILKFGGAWGHLGLAKVRPTSVDGKNDQQFIWRQAGAIKLLPGHHTITFMPEDNA